MGYIENSIQKSAFFEKNKIISITDSAGTTNQNKNKIIDPMIHNKYYSTQVNEAIDFYVSGSIDTFFIVNTNIKAFNLFVGFNSDVLQSYYRNMVTSSEKNPRINNNGFFKFHVKPNTSIYSLRLEITSTYDNQPVNIGYAFASNKIGDIDLYDGSIEVINSTQSLQNTTSDGSIWSTIINNKYAFNVSGLIESQNNIFEKIKNDYLMLGQPVIYVHNYGLKTKHYVYDDSIYFPFKEAEFSPDDDLNYFRGIFSSIIFDQNFEFGQNYYNNQENYTGLSIINGTMLPSGGA